MCGMLFASMTGTNTYTKRIGEQKAVDGKR